MPGDADLGRLTTRTRTGQLTHYPTHRKDDRRADRRANHREYQRGQRANPGPRLTDRAPVAAHLDALRDAGMTLADIAAVSGYSRSYLHDVMAGRSQRIRAIAAEDLLSIPVRSAAA